MSKMCLGLDAEGAEEIETRKGEAMKLALITLLAQEMTGKFWLDLTTFGMACMLIGIEIGRWRERGNFWLLRSARCLSISLIGTKP
jgi:hypothetical protein